MIKTSYRIARRDNVGIEYLTREKHWTMNQDEAFIYHEKDDAVHVLSTVLKALHKKCLYLYWYRLDVGVTDLSFKWNDSEALEKTE